MRRGAVAFVVAVSALLAGSRPIRGPDPMLTLESPLIFFAIEIFTDFKNIPKFPSLPEDK